MTDVILSPSEYKHQLSIITIKVMEQALALSKANGELKALTGKEYVDYWLGDVVSNAFNQWINQICKEVSLQYKGSTTTFITQDDLPKQVRSISPSLEGTFRMEMLVSPALQDALSDFVNTFDYPLLCRPLTQCAEELESRGLTNIAEDILVGLGLRCYGSGREKFNKSKRHISFDISVNHDGYIGGYSYNTREKFAKIHKNLVIAEKEIGDYGLGYYFGLLNSLMQEGSIDSGTKVGSKDVIEFRVFNGHIRVNLTNEVFCGLMAFIMPNKKPDTNVHLPNTISEAA